jgi:hypothetical protein
VIIQTAGIMCDESSELIHLVCEVYREREGRFRDTLNTGYQQSLNIVAFVVCHLMTADYTIALMFIFVSGCESNNLE